MSRSINSRNISFLALTLFVLTALALPLAVKAQSEPFAIGADISWIPEREAPPSNVRYAHNGQVMDILDILKDHGFNYIRLRLFVDPTAEVPEDRNVQRDWYASPYSTRGYCGLDSTIKFAQRIKAKGGFKFLLDFHYSDTWADPGKQYKPVSWRGLNFVQLTERVRTYTRESLEKFRDNGVLPDMVQVGNEVIHGMIHPDGRNPGSVDFATLINAGINGVKDVDSSILIMVHTVSENNPNGWINTLRTRLNQVEANAANKIDVIGLSYYPRWHGDIDSLRRVLNTIANNSSHNYKISIVEYADRHREVNDLVFALPPNRRFGTFVWEPQEFSGDNSLPLFDWRNNRRETNARMALYPIMARDYNPTTSINEKATAAQIRRNDLRVGHNGVIHYLSDAPGTVTVHNVQGRIIGRFDIKSPGTYNPANFLKMRSGTYLMTVEQTAGKKEVFSYRVVR